MLPSINNYEFYTLPTSPETLHGQDPLTAGESLPHQEIRSISATSEVGRPSDDHNRWSRKGIQSEEHRMTEPQYQQVWDCYLYVRTLLASELKKNEVLQISRNDPPPSLNQRPSLMQIPHQNSQGLGDYSFRLLEPLPLQKYYSRYQEFCETFKRPVPENPISETAFFYWLMHINQTKEAYLDYIDYSQDVPILGIKAFRSQTLNWYLSLFYKEDESQTVPVSDRERMVVRCFFNFLRHLWTLQVLTNKREPQMVYNILIDRYPFSEKKEELLYRTWKKKYHEEIEAVQGLLSAQYNTPYIIPLKELQYKRRIRSTKSVSSAFLIQKALLLQKELFRILKELGLATR
jgi:hypothetical protein